MSRSCLIVGAGIVGEELGLQLLEATDLRLLLTTRSPESSSALASRGFPAEILDLRDSDRVRELVAGMHHVVFTAAPSGDSAREEVYEVGVRTLAEVLNDGAHLVMSSSTGVYAEAEGGWVNESSALSESERAAPLRAGEEATLATGGCVLRFSGLISPHRGPQRAVERLSETEQEDRWLNLVHAADAARALRWAVETRARGVFNVSAPPQRRSEFYRPLFRAAGKAEAFWTPFEGRGYRVDPSAYVDASGLQPEPVDGEALAASASFGGQGGPGQSDG